VRAVISLSFTDDDDDVMMDQSLLIVSKKTAIGWRNQIAL